MVVTLGQQYNIGEKPTVILYTYILLRLKMITYYLTNTIKYPPPDLATSFEDVSSKQGDNYDDSSLVPRL